MKSQLQKKLKSEGRSLRWFYDNYTPAISYNALALQLNGYAQISEQTRKAIHKYLKEN